MLSLIRIPVLIVTYLLSYEFSCRVAGPTLSYQNMVISARRSLGVARRAGLYFSKSTQWDMQLRQAT